MKTGSSGAFLLTEHIHYFDRNKQSVLKALSEVLYEHVCHRVTPCCMGFAAYLLHYESQKETVWRFGLLFAACSPKAARKKKQTLPENNTRRTFPCFSNVQLNKKHRLWEGPLPIRKSQDKHHNIKWQLSTIQMEEYQQMSDHPQQRMEKAAER